MRVERAGRQARPHYISGDWRGPSLLDGPRPFVRTGLKSARQLMAAAPIREWSGRAFRSVATDHGFLHPISIRETGDGSGIEKPEIQGMRV